MSHNPYPKFPVSAAEIAAYHGPVEVISLGSPIGFNDEQIMFNAHGMRNILGMGGLGGLAISSFDGERSSIDVGIIDLGNGRAGATGSSVKTTAAIQRSNLEDIGPDFEDFYDDIFKRPLARIELNSNELDDAIVSSRRQTVRGVLDPGSRARVINRAVKQGLSQSLNRRLLHDISTVRLTATMLVGGEAAALLYDSNVVNATALLLAASQSGIWMTAMMTASRGYSPRDRLKSLSPVAPVDRLLAAQAMLKTTTLVTARHIDR